MGRWINDDESWVYQCHYCKTYLNLQSSGNTFVQKCDIQNCFVDWQVENLYYVIGKTVCVSVCSWNNDRHHFLFSSLSNCCRSKQLMFIGFLLLLRHCWKAAELWSVCSPLREISICSLQMPSVSTTRSLSALRLRAGTVKIISHSKCSWKHLDIQLSIYFKCMLCSLHTLLIVAF